MNTRGFFLSILSILILCNVARAQFNEYAVPEKYLQYVPIAVDFAFPLVGVKAEDPFVDRLVAGAVGFLSEAVIVNTLKYTIKEPRPDGSANNSFPSGHSATAFLGAELVRHEYGWGWGAGAMRLRTAWNAQSRLHLPIMKRTAITIISIRISPAGITPVPSIPLTCGSSLRLWRHAGDLSPAAISILHGRCAII